MELVIYAPAETSVYRNNPVPSPHFGELPTDEVEEINIISINFSTAEPWRGARSRVNCWGNKIKSASCVRLVCVRLDRQRFQQRARALDNDRMGSLRKLFVATILFSGGWSFVGTGVITVFSY